MDQLQFLINWVLAFVGFAPFTFNDDELADLFRRIGKAGDKLQALVARPYVAGALWVVCKLLRGIDARATTAADAAEDEPVDQQPVDREPYAPVIPDSLPTVNVRRLRSLT